MYIVSVILLANYFFFRIFFYIRETAINRIHTIYNYQFFTLLQIQMSITNRFPMKINNKVKNPKKDINYIEGATHSYEGKEEVLAKELKEFLNKI